jgi:hypothetical protein
MAAWDIQGRDALSASSMFDGQVGFDSSGWQVNFGSGSIDATRSQVETGKPAGTLAAFAPAFDQYLPYAIAAAALVIAWRMTRKR